MNAQQRIDQLLETTEVRNPEGWTIKKIIQRLGPELGPAIAGKLEASLAMMSDAHVPFTRTTLGALSQQSGLAIDDPQSQALIDQLAAYSQSLPETLRWDTNFVAAIKALGVEIKPRWYVEGYQAEPTIAQIQQEIDRDRARRNVASVAVAFQLVQHKMTNGEIVDLQQVIDAVAADIAEKWED